MSRRDPTVSLRQMRDHAPEAVHILRGRTRGDLDSDRILSLALVRLLEIVGEAANRVPAAERSKHSSIPWTAVVGLRNRLVHGYDEVDLDTLWRIVHHDMPPLVIELDRILATGESP